MYNLHSDTGHYFCLGRIVKTTSWRGELVFFLDVDEPADYAGLEMVFIDIRGSLVPFFIEEISLRGDTAIVKLEDVDNPAEAQKLLKCGLYLPLDKLKPMKDEGFYFHEVTGYSAFDREHGHIGTVAEILQRPEQDIIRIIHKDKEILVPLTVEMIEGIDRETRSLYLKTPEGLIDLYL
jgi:16S rRNA processing protein RimM